MKTCSKELKKRSYMLSVLSYSTICCRQSAVAFTTPTFRRIQPRVRVTNTHHRSLHETFLSDQKNGNAPDLILPSHPSTPIRTVMAPMVAASDYPFRYLLRKYDVDLTFTQMLHCKNYINDETFRLSHLDLWEAGAKYPDLLRSQLSCLGDFPPPMGPQEGDCASPLIVQLAGNQPDLLVQQALMILEHTDGKVTGFDLNLGCPQQIAKKKGSYGAFLMERDLDLVCNILSSLRDSVPETTTVSAKIRLPTDDETLCYRIPKLVNTGINFLTIHGRTLVENKTKVGAAHVDRIKLAIDKAHEVNPNLPVIANGGMETYEDIQEVMWKTGASAAMSSEALLETPNVFSPKSSGLSPRERLTQQISFATEYLDICKNVAPPLPGVLGNGGSFKIVRGHLFKFLYRYLNEHTDLRDRLGGDQKLQTLGEASNLVDELAERCLKLSDDELLRCASSAPESSWYRRHRKGNRRVHQKEVRVDSSLVPSGSEEETIESRKQEIRDRISQMKERKAAREASAANRFVA